MRSCSVCPVQNPVTLDAGGRCSAGLCVFRELSAPGPDQVQALLCAVPHRIPRPAQRTHGTPTRSLPRPPAPWRPPLSKSPSPPPTAPACVGEPSPPGPAVTSRGARRPWSPSSLRRASRASGQVRRAHRQPRRRAIDFCRSQEAMQLKTVTRMFRGCFSGQVR
jgi:hypothetical protein